MLESVEAWPQATARERQHYERSRWVMHFLYHTALRATETAHAKAADFFHRRGRWWLHVVGKGGAEGEVPVSDALMVEFGRYRTFHGLPPLPSPSDQSPAILSVAGDVKRHLTPTAVYLIAKAVFGRAADTLAPTDPAGAATLRRASTHWQRHSAASHQADAGTDIRFIQKNLRHASIETTGLYLHAEDDRRHAHPVGQSQAQHSAAPVPRQSVLIIVGRPIMKHSDFPIGLDFRGPHRFPLALHHRRHAHASKSHSCATTSGGRTVVGLTRPHRLRAPDPATESIGPLAR